MGKIEKAAEWAEKIAGDGSHGYDQTNRWGPDYDCSSLVISAWEQAGVPVKSKGATYTGNMKPVFLSCGFADITSSVNLSTGAGMQRGDVLLNVRSHTAMYTGYGKLLQASGNEKGGITGGTPGDQTGREIGTVNYYNFPWDCVLRYQETAEKPAGGAAGPATGGSGTYIVQSGDSLWSIAERLLGNGAAYVSIRLANNLVNDVIHPGQVLKIPGKGTTAGTVTLTVDKGTYNAMEAKAESLGLTVEAMLRAEYGG